MGAGHQQLIACGKDRCQTDAALPSPGYEPEHLDQSSTRGLDRLGLAPSFVTSPADQQVDKPRVLEVDIRLGRVVEDTEPTAGDVGERGQTAHRSDGSADR